MKYLLCGLFLMLAACSDAPVHQDVVYVPPATPGGRMCLDQCIKSRDFCHQSCDLDNRACYNDVQTRAEHDYDAYARARFTGHAPIDMFPSDFEHPEACIAAKKNCVAACDQPYNECYRSCGGAITVTTSCQSFCFE